MTQEHECLIHIRELCVYLKVRWSKYCKKFRHQVMTKILSQNFAPGKWLDEDHQRLTQDQCYEDRRASPVIVNISALFTDSELQFFGFTKRDLTFSSFKDNLSDGSVGEDEDQLLRAVSKISSIFDSLKHLAQ